MRTHLRYLYTDILIVLLFVIAFIASKTYASSAHPVYYEEGMHVAFDYAITCRDKDAAEFLERAFRRSYDQGIHAYAVLMGMQRHRMRLYKHEKIKANPYMCSTTTHELVSAMTARSQYFVGMPYGRVIEMRLYGSAHDIIAYVIPLKRPILEPAQGDHMKKKAKATK